MYAPHVLSAARDYDALYPLVPLAGAGALQYRRRRLRSLGRGRAAAAPPFSTCAPMAPSRRSATARCAKPRTGSPTCSEPAASGAATGSRSCCRRRRRSPPATSPSTSSAPSRCRSRCCSASRRSPIGCADSGARALITNAQGLAKLSGMPRWRARPRAGAVDRRSGRRRRRLSRGAGARFIRFRAGRHRRRRSRADGLHLGHDRAAQGRAACPPGAARAFARHRGPARVPAAARRPVLDAGGLGLGRRPAQRAAAGPALRRAGGGRALREVRSRGGVRADGEDGRAQFLHPADGAAHAALGAAPEGRRCACARSAPAARRSAPRPTNGAARRSGSPSTSSTARPNAIWCSPPARRSACRAPARSASRCPATPWR